jgi:hypothetical protein
MGLPGCLMAPRFRFFQQIPAIRPTAKNNSVTATEFHAIAVESI